MASLKARANNSTGNCSVCLKRCRRPTITCKAVPSQAQAWPRPRHVRRPAPACRAEERSRDSTKTSEAERLKVPDVPPSKGTDRTADVSLFIWPSKRIITSSKASEHPGEHPSPASRVQARLKSKPATFQTS